MERIYDVIFNLNIISDKYPKYLGTKNAEVVGRNVCCKTLYKSQIQLAGTKLKTKAGEM
jgi:hypothetical protein